MIACLVLVAGLRRRLAGAPEAAEPLWIADLRGFVLDERIGRTAALQQHVAEQLARRDQAAGADRVLFALVLEIGSGEHLRQALVALTLGKPDPRLGADALHLDFGRPVIVLGRLQRLA